MEEKCSIDFGVYDFLEALERVVMIANNLRDIDYVDWTISYSGKTKSVNKLGAGINDILSRYGIGKKITHECHTV